MKHDFQTVDFRRAGNRLGVRLMRPAVRNAFNDIMITELTAIFEEAAADPDLRCLILRGEGPVFCAGADVNWMREAASYSQQDNLEDARKLSRLFQAFISVPCPTIAVIQGAALGGGAGLAACADIAIAETGAKFGFTEVRLGIVPAAISPFVLRKLPAQHARRYFASGEFFDGRRAAEIGLVSEAVPSQELQARVDEVVVNILGVGPHAAREAKSLVEEVAGRSVDDVTEYTAETIARLRATDEAREGMSAFLEKRPPVRREDEL